MDTQQKLSILGQAAYFDDCCTLFTPPRNTTSTTPDLSAYVAHVSAPGGRRVAVLKILQTNICQNDCLYCAFRTGRDVRRAHFTADELAGTFDRMYRSGLVEGLFLSSGIAGRQETMDEMLATAELVRTRYACSAYMHLKLLPGAEAGQIQRAVELADRVSTNLEAPTPQHLAALAPRKQMSDLLGPLRLAAEHVRGLRAGGRNYGKIVGRTRLGISTQFVVGPAGESDRDLLATVQLLYREGTLSRAFYSAFSPVPGTPLDSVPPTDPRREYRLYQADWLLRHYHFSVDDLPFEEDGRLNLRRDPKSAWAQAHPERFPIEVNRAPVADLLRVPGIGPVSAKAIIKARKQGSLRSLADLRRLGARVDQAAPYVLLAGRRPPLQLMLPLGVEADRQ